MSDKKTPFPLSGLPFPCSMLRWEDITDMAGVRRQALLVSFVDRGMVRVAHFGLDAEAKAWEYLGEAL